MEFAKRFGEKSASVKIDTARGGAFGLGARFGANDSGKYVS